MDECTGFCCCAQWHPDKAQVGQVLTVNPGTWSPAPVYLRYQWFRAGVSITGATTSTYTPTTADISSTLSVRVIGSKTGYITAGRPSAQTAAVIGNTLAGPTPKISGTARVGQTLTAIPGTWSPAPVTLRYQWFRAGTAITGATAVTYKPTTADVGSQLYVRVIGSKAGYVTLGRPSAKTTAIVR